jgi:hypothetical protein
LKLWYDDVLLSSAAFFMYGGGICAQSWTNLQLLF